MYPTENLIKCSQEKKVHKQIHVKFCCIEKHFALPKSNIKNTKFLKKFAFIKYFLDVHGKIIGYFMKHVKLNPHNGKEN